MRLRPRHFVLLAIVVGLFVYNIVQGRIRQRDLLRQQRQAQAALAAGAWSAFDRAAALRDAPDAQYLPAYDALRQATEDNAAPSSTAPSNTTTSQAAALAPVRGCKTWLMFYRQPAPAYATPHPTMHDRAAAHVATCMAAHRDSGQ